jgi:hypothetical protein
MAWFTFSHTHTHKIETKRTIKIKTPQNNIEKTKRRGKRKISKKK